MGEMTELVVAVVAAVVVALVYLIRRQRLIDRRAEELAEELAAQQRATEQLSSELALHREFSQALIEARSSPSVPVPPRLTLAYDHIKGRLLAVGGIAVGLGSWIRQHPAGAISLAAASAALMAAPSFSPIDQPPPSIALPGPSELRPPLEPDRPTEPAPKEPGGQERSAPNTKRPRSAPGPTDPTDATGQTAAPPPADGQQNGAPSTPSRIPPGQPGEPQQSPQRDEPPSSEDETDSPPKEEEPRREPNPEPSCSVAYVAAKVPSSPVGPAESETCLGSE